jgi:ribosomal protein S18 acetylase RimI-like enzyme
MPDPTIRAYLATDEDALVALWTCCGLIRPQNDPHADIARKRAEQPDLLLVADLEGRIIGSVMVGYEGHRGWVNYLAVDPSERRRGLGTALMAAAEAELRLRGCPKINLQVRSGNEPALGFYRALGFAVDEVVSLGKRLVVDAAG